MLSIMDITSITKIYHALNLLTKPDGEVKESEQREALDRLRDAVNRLDEIIVLVESTAKAIEKNKQAGNSLVQELDIENTFETLKTICGMKNTHDWLGTRPGLIIMEPDGWDRSCDDDSIYVDSMAELISEEEFNRRLSMSKTMDKVSGEIEEPSPDGF